MIDHNSTAADQFKYARESLTDGDILALLEELDDYREAAGGEAYPVLDEGAEELRQRLEQLTGNQANPDHADYDEYKAFFDDCVASLKVTWPCAHPRDEELCQIIREAITNGE